MTNKIIVILCFLFIPFSKACASEHNFVAVHIYLYADNDVKHFMSHNCKEIYQEFFKRKINKKWPETKVKFITAKNKLQLKEKLAVLLEEDEKISHLRISTHGNSEKKLYKGIEIVESILTVGESDRLTFKYPLEFGDLSKDEIYKINQESIDIFSPISNRFSDKALVFIDSCNVVSGFQKERDSKANAFQLVFNFQNGELFALKNEGRDYRVLLSGHPIKYLSWSIWAGIVSYTFLTLEDIFLNPLILGERRLKMTAKLAILAYFLIRESIEKNDGVLFSIDSGRILNQREVDYYSYESMFYNDEENYSILNKFFF